MRRFMMTVMALVAFGAMVAAAQAENRSARPTQAVSVAQSTCTELKSACRSGKDWNTLCSWGAGILQLYMGTLHESGFWEGGVLHLHRPAERR
jgi:hypothetical protein